MAELESRVGKNCKVMIGLDTVLGIGNWSIGGGAVAELDDTEFGDEYNDVILGLFTGGSVSFAGLYKSGDTSGQQALKKAFFSRTALVGSTTGLRFFINDTSFYCANDTTAVGLGGLPAGVPVSKIYITSEPQISSDRSGLMQISFTGKVVGAMRLY